MLVKAFEIICAIFTVFGIYTFVHDMVDLLAAAVRKKEIKRLEKEMRKEREDRDDTEGSGG